MMRAKMKVTGVTASPGAVNVTMMAVTEKPFDAEGKSEDNDFARWTPCASLSITIQNPALLEAFKEGQTFYLDFTEHVD
jgi:hypothetical protein